MAGFPLSKVFAMISSPECYDVEFRMRAFTDETITLSIFKRPEKVTEANRTERSLVVQTDLPMQAWRELCRLFESGKVT